MKQSNKIVEEQIRKNNELTNKFLLEESSKVIKNYVSGALVVCSIAFVLYLIWGSTGAISCLCVVVPFTFKLVNDNIKDRKNSHYFGLEHKMVEARFRQQKYNERANELLIEKKEELDDSLDDLLDYLEDDESNLDSLNEDLSTLKEEFQEEEENLKSSFEFDKSENDLERIRLKNEFEAQKSELESKLISIRMGKDYSEEDEKYRLGDEEDLMADIEGLSEEYLEEVESLNSELGDTKKAFRVELNELIGQFESDKSIIEKELKETEREIVKKENEIADLKKEIKKL